MHVFARFRCSVLESSKVTDGEALLPLHHTTAEGALLLALVNATGWGAGRGFVRDSVGGFAAAANIVEPDPKLA